MKPRSQMRAVWGSKLGPLTRPTTVVQSFRDRVSSKLACFPFAPLIMILRDLKPFLPDKVLTYVIYFIQRPSAYRAMSEGSRGKFT